MTQTEEYPLPTVHLNGTSKEMLYKGNIHILQAIHDLEDTICKCVFHGRDYYVLDADPYSLESYQAALKERQKHLKNLESFREYIEKQINHIDGQ